ncbi:MAG TPA: YaeQ family protein [Thermoanaerobaculia bacterium]
MALTSTIYNASVELNDVDRGVYESIALRLAMHPSETMEYMATRLMAYCLEYTEGIEMTAGLSDGDEPAIVVRDLTGRITAWIEVGLPDADRLHRASKLAPRVAVYTHRDIRILLGQLEGRRIHRAEDLAIYSFAGDFVRELAARLERRTKMSLSVTERHLYLDVNGHALATVVEQHSIAAR